MNILYIHIIVSFAGQQPQHNNQRPDRLEWYTYGLLLQLGANGLNNNQQSAVD